MKSLRAVLLPLAALLLLGACQSLPDADAPPAPPISLAPTTAPTVEGLRRAAPPCADGQSRSVLVTGFPLLHPEQIPYGGFAGWPEATAEVLAQTLAQGGRLRATAAPRRFPFATPATAPALERRDGKPLAADWARAADAQFLLAGVFRDFAVVPSVLWLPERHLVVDAWLFDATDGRLLAQREFAWKLPFSRDLPEATPGTRAFAATRFGRLFHTLLDEMAHWAEDSLACQPVPRPAVRMDRRGIPTVNVTPSERR